MTPTRRRETVDAMTDAEFSAVNWWLIDAARDNQVPPAGDWTLWLLMAGRGYGKTRVISEFAHLKADALPGSQGVIIAATAADLRDIVIEGISGIMNTGNRSKPPEYNPSKRRITWPNGSKATIISADNPDRLRGPQCHWFIADELAVWRYGVEAWDMLMFGFRLGDKPQGAIATTPKNTKVLRDVLSSDGLIITRGSTYENRENLSPVFFSRVIKKYEGTRLGRQELNAELLTDNPGALWKRQPIDAARILQAPQLQAVAVAMDPSATARGDECGIIGGGVAEGRGYVLEDATIQGSPEQQARAAITLYHKLKADHITVETNNGGEWLGTVIHNIDASVRVIEVRASRGKYTRAEPVSALYEQGRVHHVGTFAELEDELCQWEPGDDSPNRLDALVWLFSDLLLKPRGVFVG